MPFVTMYIKFVYKLLRGVGIFVLCILIVRDLFFFFKKYRFKMPLNTDSPPPFFRFAEHVCKKI